jgi:hypothetical protein
MAVRAAAAASLLMLSHPTTALDNGVSLLPPMVPWRHLLHSCCHIRLTPYLLYLRSL